MVERNRPATQQLNPRPRYPLQTRNLSMPTYTVVCILRRFPTPRHINPQAYAALIRQLVRNGTEPVKTISVLMSDTQDFPTLDAANSGARKRVDRFMARSRDHYWVYQAESNPGMVWYLLFLPDGTDVFDVRVHQRPPG